MSYTLTNWLSANSRYTVILLNSILWVACSSKIEDAKAVSANEQIIMEQIEGAAITYTRGNRKTMVLTAPLLWRHAGSKPYVEFPKGVRVVAYKKDSQQIATIIDADYAIEQAETETILAQGNVEVKNEKGEKLNTEELYWNRAKRRIYTDKFVKITNRTEIITGRGLEADEKFESYSIKKIEGTVEINGNE